MKKAAVIRNFATIAFLLAFLIVLPAVRADEWNQATKFTFSQPVQIPGHALPAGTYLFEIVTNFNHEMVRISSPDRSNVFALIQAIPTYQQGLSSKAAIILAERGESQPEAIVAWSYPGRVEGHQLLYPKQVRKRTREGQAGHYRVRRLTSILDIKHQLAGGEIQAPPAEVEAAASERGMGSIGLFAFDRQHSGPSRQRSEGRYRESTETSRTTRVD